MIHRRTLIHAAQFVIVFAALSALVWAQWPAYSTRGVPKTPDGKPDVNGPVPRMPDGKPDLSGIWEAARLPGQGQRGTPSNAPLQPTQPPTPNTASGPPIATFL